MSRITLDSICELLKNHGFYFEPAERQLRRIGTASPVSPAEVLAAIPELSADYLKAYVRQERAIWVNRDSIRDDDDDWSNCPI